MGDDSPSRKAWGVGLLCVAIAAAWLLIRANVTRTHPAYELRLGVNVARNTLALALFYFNVPREALRLVIVNRSVAAGVWGAVCFALQAAAFGLILRAARARLGGKGLAFLTLFVLIGCAPYFFLSWHCYAYYTSIGLFAYAILVALAAHRPKTILIAALLAVSSSAVSTLGNHRAEYPALVARAHWAQRQLRAIERLPEDRRQEIRTRRLWVSVKNWHKFEGFGVPGLAYTLDVQEQNIVVLRGGAPPPHDRPLLIVPAEGDVSFIWPGSD